MFIDHINQHVYRYSLTHRIPLIIATVLQMAIEKVDLAIEKVDLPIKNSDVP